MPDYEEWTDRLETTTVPIDHNDVEVAYYDEGSGDPVVFLHGIPTSSYLWQDVVGTIADRQRAIVPDMAGYGASSKRDGFDRSIRAQEAMIDALLDDLGFETVDFVGHDLGGGVGLRLAARSPERVDRLVLSNAVAYDSWPIEPIVDLGLPSTARETSVDDLQGMLDELIGETVAGEPDEEFLEGTKAPWDSEEGVVSLVRDAAATNTNHTTEIDPGGIDAETLLLWGADDEFQEIEWAERLESEMPNARLVGLDGANHWVMEDRPEAYREELAEFLL